MLSYKIIRTQDLTTSSWSGGTTTQLAIYPENTVYAERNFKWRVSTAKVDIEESTFTQLPHVSRIIMPLQGTLHLVHEGHHESLLKPFEQDSFMGDWKTVCYGKAIDFNLMITEGEGMVKALDILPFAALKIPILPEFHENSWKYFSLIIYPLSGIEIQLANEEPVKVAEQEVIILTDKLRDVGEDQSIRVKNYNGVTINIIQAFICHN